MLIKTTSDLENLCTQLTNENFVCVDLEFLREHSYFAKLCLIQIASPSTEAIIDPLSPDIDLNPFFELMKNPSITKVFHSGRQDIELIYQMGHCIPSPLFDTQIAASALGFGESISYENLVKNLLKMNLDKTSRLSDWSKRPLSQEQTQYAIGDVSYLCKMYPIIIDNLNRQNRLHWIEEEFEVLKNPALYSINPQDVWKKMRHRSHNPKFLTLLRELAAWRETRAINKNVPRQSFIKDDILLNICSACPQTKDDLIAIRGVRKDLAQGKIGDEIIEVVQKFKLLDKQDYVSICCDDKNICIDNALFEMLKMLLRIISSQNNVSQKLIASDDDLKLFCQEQASSTKFTQGWRYEIFGKLALQICNGTTGLIYNAKNHSVELFKA